MMKRMFKNRAAQGLLMLGLAAGSGGAAYAQDWPCDCRKVVASCQATMEIIPTKSPGTKLFGADLRVRANAPYCAKVEYYIDSTPHMTLLTDGKYAEDRLLGVAKKAIRPEQVEVFSCKVCESRDASRQAEDKQAQIQAQIDALVSESVQSGNLQPDYSRVAAPPPPDASALMQSMQQLIQTHSANQRSSSARQAASSSGGQRRSRGRSYCPGLGDCGIRE
ncbi:hypothetical protein [Castellaniella sp.]|uniref:hypothetical protein n=1 Tax=Castellaniella sp. TaxID=1955812 RepID=UPI003C73C20D